MKDIIIIGAGGFGREVEFLIERINEVENQWNILGYADDNVKIGTKIGNSEVICTVDDLKQNEKKVSIVLALGNTKIRKNIFEKISSNLNIDFPNLIDPSVIVGKRTSLGKGNIICAGTIMTVDIKIKDFCIINLDCTIGHDDIINSFVTIYPSVNVSGNVTLNENIEIGTGTQIIQGKNIVSNCIIGAGAVVVKNIEEAGTYVGVPAKKK